MAVTYDWSGFQRPLREHLTVKAGRTVPVTFSLEGRSAGIGDADATLRYAPVDDDGMGKLTEARSRAGEDGSFPHVGGGRYVLTWSTKGIAPGEYRLVADLGDGVQRALRVTLR